MDIASILAIAVSCVSLATAAISIALIFRQIKKADLEILKLKNELAEKNRNIHTLNPEQITQVLRDLDRASSELEHRMISTSKSLYSLHEQFLEGSKRQLKSLTMLENGTLELDTSTHHLVTVQIALTEELSRATEIQSELTARQQELSQHIENQLKST
ncbi:MAG: hypothetical protein HOG05_17220 [Bacteroidetes bacterium]|jgi:paraquat-inducible protein B|nr:hypothetical protein [Bacteroidota bacterium]MBT5530904.1 hypothetical protein [Cytophagia bacterium]